MMPEKDNGTHAPRAKRVMVALQCRMVISTARMVMLMAKVVFTARHVRKYVQRQNASGQTHKFG